ncbi:LCP family protein [Microbacterium sp. M3]|uniref:LCP family protein n=1 Tax=Microbacterium arthrosphaerae TaxID=792652 RepID=A0ABU4H660_9MICO|nr:MULTISPECIES: LCP family protein [Microbacterium]MDW4573379.1 LCP family protein [Microbacterium arthrosphaerae]MDW7607234.1 LCP family protein [Microbacterium sp. M3]
MSVMSAPRTHARPAGPGVVEERPMRYPDASSRAVMTRRGWWLIALNFLIPGSAQVLAGNRRLGRFGIAATLLMWVLAVVALLFALLAPTAGLSIITSAWLPDWLGLLRPLPLLIAQGLLIAYAVLWAVLTIDTLRLVRLVKTGTWARFAIALVGIALMVVASGTAAYASNAVGTVRSTISSIFGASGPTVPPDDGYYNILLLGADSGEGRDSMRFDSISVVSVNAATGATTITGIPRDMPNFPFAEGPMQDRYPNGHEGHADPSCGWGSGINQLRTEVEVCQDGTALYPDAEANGSEPAIEATKDAAEGILGITIPYYVFVDMHGFASLVDALGGVDINVTERLPKGGPPEGVDPHDVDSWAIGWIEPGQQHMDGDTAQWYARSRYTTSDFDRMERQRELQEAILAQFTPQVVLTRFQDVAAAGADIVKTDLPQSLIPTLVDLGMKAREQQVTTIELTPAGGIDEFDPDYAYIAELMQTTLHPPTPTPSGE